MSGSPLRRWGFGPLAPSRTTVPEYDVIVQRYLTVTINKVYVWNCLHSFWPSKALRRQTWLATVVFVQHSSGSYSHDYRPLTCILLTPTMDLYCKLLVATCWQRATTSNRMWVRHKRLNWSFLRPRPSHSQWWNTLGIYTCEDYREKMWHKTIDRNIQCFTYILSAVERPTAARKQPPLLQKMPYGERGETL